MDLMEWFKVVHSELIMSVQYIEEDLRIIYSTVKPGDYDENRDYVENKPMGGLLKELHELDIEVGYSKIKKEDYELLDDIREIRNYWCHQCYLDFHYIENREEHDKKFLELVEKLKIEELKVFELQQKIEKLRKSVVKKYKYRK